MFLCSCLKHAGSFALADTLTYWHTVINTSKKVQCRNGKELRSSIILKHWIQKVKCCAGKECSFIAGAFFFFRNLCNNICYSGQLFEVEKLDCKKNKKKVDEKSVPKHSYTLFICLSLHFDRFDVVVFFTSIHSAFLIEVHMQIWLFIRDSFRAWQISAKRKCRL